ncbi:MAG TPA: ATP-binding protein [Candidatus Eisenbacteria bacterium]
MRFGTRLSLAMVAPIVLLLVGYGYLDEQRTRAQFREELRREGRTIIRTVKLALEDALRDRNISDVHQLIDQITGFERVYGLRLFDPDGHMAYQSHVLEGESFRSAGPLAAVLATRQPFESERPIGNQTVLTYIVPLVSPDGKLYGAVQLLQLRSFIDDEVRVARRSIVWLTLAMILVAGLVIIVVTRLVVDRPLGEFIDKLKAIGPIDRAERIPVKGGDELKRLAREFNLLWERLAQSHRSMVTAQEERRLAEMRLKNAERLAALGELAAGLAHQIGTPLNVIGGRADALRRRHQSEPHLDKNLQIISEQINRIARIVREMLQFAQVKALNPVPVDVDELVGSVLEFLEPRLEQDHINVHRRLPSGLPHVPADQDQLYEVFLNLMINAIDSMSGGGELTVTGTRGPKDHPETAGIARDVVSITIADTGAGIAPEDLGRIFQPFFTTKGVGRGTGLGLSVAYGIVREHGGWIDVTSDSGRGAALTVHLPVHPPEDGGGGNGAPDNGAPDNGASDNGASANRVPANGASA